MHAHEEPARREIELIHTGDDEGVAALHASDFVLRYPGRIPLAHLHRCRPIPGMSG